MSSPEISHGYTGPEQTYTEAMLGEKPFHEPSAVIMPECFRTCHSLEENMDRLEELAKNRSDTVQLLVCFGEQNGDCTATQYTEGYVVAATVEEPELLDRISSVARIVREAKERGAERTTLSALERDRYDFGYHQD